MLETQRAAATKRHVPSPGKHGATSGEPGSPEAAARAAAFDAMSAAARSIRSAHTPENASTPSQSEGSLQHYSPRFSPEAEAELAAELQLEGEEEALEQAERDVAKETEQMRRDALEKALAALGSHRFSALPISTCPLRPCTLPQNTEM